LFYEFFSLERYLMKFLACALNNKIKIKSLKTIKKV